MYLSQNLPVPGERLTIFAIDGRQCLSTSFWNVVGMVSSLHDFAVILSMVWKISSSVSVKNLSRCGVSLGSGAYACVPLKSFLMFCILLRENTAKSLASYWSDVDSGSGFCLFWPVISVTILYSFFYCMWCLY